MLTMKNFILLGAFATLLLPFTSSNNSAASWAAAPHKSTRNTAASATSNNWSGYVTTGLTYTDVKGTWKEPTITCSPNENSNSAFWVGIDGDGSNSVEQLGTSADCSHGTPQYYGWWEMYPSPAYYLGLNQYVVRPEDVLTAEVKVNGATFTLTMRNATRGWAFTTSKTSTTAKKLSAEWIAEAPSNSSGILPLANFSLVNFTNCSANGLKLSATPRLISIKMSNGTIAKATPSALTNGTNFTVTWNHQ